MSSKDDWKDYVKEDMHKKFKKMCRENSLDPYNVVVTLAVHQVLRYLNWGFPFKPISEIKKVSCEKAWEAGIKVTKGYGISVFQASCIANCIVIYSKTRSDEFLDWWNKTHG